MTSEQSSEDPSLCVPDAGDGLFVIASSHIQWQRGVVHCIFYVPEICLIEEGVKGMFVRGLHSLVVNIN